MVSTSHNSTLTFRIISNDTMSVGVDKHICDDRGSTNRRVVSTPNATVGMLSARQSPNGDNIGDERYCDCRLRFIRSFCQISFHGCMSNKF